MTTLVVAHSAAAEAERRVAAVRDDPAGRMRLAVDSYLTLDRPSRFQPYARAVVDFMRWQNARGVLTAPLRPKPGSAWWRAVNEELLLDTEEASILLRNGRGQATRPSVERWVRFFTAPSAASWYLAHNGSVVNGYLAHQDLAAGERPAERFFMNVVLLRVLFAQALFTDGDLALGRLSLAARWVGHPRLRSPGMFLAMTNVLPADYPIVEPVEELIDLENPIGRLLDFAVISGRVDALYAAAARALGEPRLLGLVDRGVPTYVFPCGLRHVWADTSTSVRRSLLEMLTRPRQPRLATAEFQPTHPQEGLIGDRHEKL